MTDPSAVWRRGIPRAEQTDDRLLAEDEQAAMERRRMGDPSIGREEPIMAYVAHQALGARAMLEQTGQPLTEALSAYGEPAAIESILLTVSRHLEKDAVAIANLSRGQQFNEDSTRRASKKSQSKSAVPSLPTAVRQQSPKARVLSGGVVLGQPKRGSDSLTDDDPATSIGIEDFYKDDVFRDVELPLPVINTDVNVWPAFRPLVEMYNKQFQQAAVRATYDTEVEKLPHPHLPTCTRAYRTFAMLPPRPNMDRLCKYGSRCQCMSDPGRTGYAYTGREFLHPGERRLRTPDGAGPCILCLDDEVRLKYLQYQRERCTPTTPLNTYTVSRDKKTGYPSTMLLISEMEHRPTGIVGLYPEYRESRYDFRPIPAGLAKRAGLNYPGAPTHFKTEVGLEFFH